MFYFRMDGAEISLIDGKRELRFMSGRDKKHSRHVPHDKKYQLTTATEPVFFLYSFFFICSGVTNLRLLQAYQNRNGFKTQCRNLQNLQKKGDKFLSTKRPKSESGVVKNLI